MAVILLLLVLFTSALGASSLHRGQRAADDGFLMVNTSYGTLRGKVDSTPSVPVAKFLGVPFAKPPTGPLRFKAPVKSDSWDGVRDALTFGDECLQGDNPNFPFRGGNTRPPRSEDCLFLNVYSPTQRNGQALLPVMVWIHGGAYLMGSGSAYDVTTLATKGVLVVTINYRLNIFGFLSTGDDTMPGNYGMMDQIAALKWVRDNIASFGGDPNLVTIFGESAGSASVSLLTLSPLAKGLFQRAVMESGVSLSPWAVEFPGNRVSSRMAARLASQAVQCDDLNNSTALLSCLQQADAVKLLNASTTLANVLQVGLVLWNPRVETTFGFLPESPSTLLSRGQINHVDTLRGFNSDEFGIFTPIFSRKPPVQITAEVAKQVIGAQVAQFNQLNQGKLLGLLVSTYLADTSSSEVLQREALDAADNTTFVGSIMIEMNYVARSVSDKKHYLYQFNHRASFSHAPTWMSAIHGDEMFFVFDVQQKKFTDLGNGPPDANDILVSQQMMEMWTNFAKTGNPTSTVPTGGVTWSQYISPTAPHYLLINSVSELKLWSQNNVVDVYRKVLETLEGSSPAPADPIVPIFG
ncbi:neuroligin 4-like [Aplysia californica]|uniref:Carboxylic ester hydrolase n=1 Tax=Aplysia californica TaxID=6500 RepID=A0ABM0JQ00_APLCA|nr:neuroligin 4-like [Aplysia californica]